MKIVYLSSTDYGWWNLKSKNWKNEIYNEFKKQGLEFNFIDPLQFKTTNPQIAKIDLEDINRSKYVIVYLDKITIGTMFELSYCVFQRRKNFYVLTKNKDVLKHPWIVYFCNNVLYTDVKKLVKKIKENESRNNSITNSTSNELGERRKPKKPFSKRFRKRKKFESNIHSDTLSSKS